MKRSLYSSRDGENPIMECRADGNGGYMPGPRAGGPNCKFNHGCGSEVQQDDLGDLWECFVRDNWAPTLEAAFGPSWRDRYPEDVTAILWWALNYRTRSHIAATTPAGLVSSDNTAVAGLQQSHSAQVTEIAEEFRRAMQHTAQSQVANAETMGAATQQRAAEQSLVETPVSAASTSPNVSADTSTPSALQHNTIQLPVLRTIPAASPHPVASHGSATADGRPSTSESTEAPSTSSSADSAATITSQPGAQKAACLIGGIRITGADGLDAHDLVQQLQRELEQQLALGEEPSFEFDVQAVAPPDVDLAQIEVFPEYAEFNFVLDAAAKSQARETGMHAAGNGGVTQQHQEDSQASTSTPPSPQLFLAPNNASDPTSSSTAAAVRTPFVFKASTSRSAHSKVAPGTAPFRGTRGPTPSTSTPSPHPVFSFGTFVPAGASGASGVPSTTRAFGSMPAGFGLPSGSPVFGLGPGAAGSGPQPWPAGVSVPGSPALTTAEMLHAAAPGQHPQPSPGAQQQPVAAAPALAVPSDPADGQPPPPVADILQHLPESMPDQHAPAASTSSASAVFSIPLQYVPVQLLSQNGSAPGVSAKPSNTPFYLLNTLLSGQTFQSIVDGVDAAGRCPLHVAAAAGRVDVVEQLLYVGCDASRVLQHDFLEEHKQLGEAALRLLEARESLARTSGSPKDAGGLSVMLGLLSFEGCTALHLAAYFGHLQVVELLLRVPSCGITVRSSQGLTALHMAANQGHAQVVAKLARAAGIELDAADASGHTALHHAAALGFASCVEELWPRGCDLEAMDPVGRTPLHLAAEAGHADVTSKLVIAGCHVQKLDRKGYAAGHYAAQGGFADVLEKLLLAGYEVDMLGGLSAAAGAVGGSTALHMAAAAGHDAVVATLLQHNCNVSKEDPRGRTALQAAAQGGHLRCFELLLVAGSNASHKDQQGTSVLHSAAEGGRWEIVQQLLDLGCSLDGRSSSGQTILHYAALGGVADAMRNLLDLGCDINARSNDDSTPLHLVVQRHGGASEESRLEAAGLLLDKGASLQARDNAGRTPLHAAASNGSDSMLALLLQRGAEASLLCSQQQTALHCAAQSGHKDALALLLQHMDEGAANRQDARGWSVLHHAAHQGAVGSVTLLIASGADVNAVTLDSWTPLHLAARAHHTAVVQKLLEAGADAAARDAAGCTAVHYAAATADTELFTMLQQQAGEQELDGEDGTLLLQFAVQGGNSEIVQQLLDSGAGGDGAALQLPPAAAATPLGAIQQLQVVFGGMNALHLASQLGAVEIVDILLEAGYTPATPCAARGCQPVHYAAMGPGAPRPKGSQPLQVLERLVEAGADSLAMDAQGCNVLMYAAGSGDAQLLEHLLSYGWDLLHQDTSGWTVLHWAAHGGHAEVVEQLLTAGASLSMVDRQGRAPLHWAAEKGFSATVTVLVEAMQAAGVDVHQVDSAGNSAVQLAASHGHVEVVAKLLESGKTREVKGLTALHLAAQNGLDQVVAQLLGVPGCDVNARDAEGLTPLHWAANKGSGTIITRLVQAGADVNATSLEGWLPLHKAAAVGSLECVTLLLQCGSLPAFKTTNGHTPLHLAAQTGAADVCKHLITAGCPVAAKTAAGCSVLYCAASAGAVDCLELLLAAGAEVDASTTSGCTPLHIAAGNGHAKATEVLLAAGADLDTQSSNGTSALHSAVAGGHMDATEVLLNAGCDCDAQNSNGNTALHIAASKGNMDLVNRLLATSCDVHIRNSKGWEAVHSASSAGFFDIVLRLVQSGAAWRAKADADVVKMICRKSNFKASYVEGRLRLAEREKHRNKKSSGPDGNGKPSQAELKELADRADAAMAALLQEEQASAATANAQAERKKNKRQNKKDSKKRDDRKEGEEDGAGPEAADVAGSPDEKLHSDQQRPPQGGVGVLPGVSSSGTISEPDLLQQSNGEDSEDMDVRTEAPAPAPPQQQAQLPQGTATPPAPLDSCADGATVVLGAVEVGGHVGFQTASRGRHGRQGSTSSNATASESETESAAYARGSRPAMPAQHRPNSTSETESRDGSAPAPRRGRGAGAAAQQAPSTTPAQEQQAAVAAAAASAAVAAVGKLQTVKSRSEQALKQAAASASTSQAANSNGHTAFVNGSKQNAQGVVVAKQAAAKSAAGTVAAPAGSSTAAAQPSRSAPGGGRGAQPPNSNGNTAQRPPPPEPDSIKRERTAQHTPKLSSTTQQHVPMTAQQSPAKQAAQTTSTAQPIPRPAQTTNARATQTQPQPVPAATWARPEPVSARPSPQNSTEQQVGSPAPGSYLEKAMAATATRQQRTAPGSAATGTVTSPPADIPIGSSRDAATGIASMQQPIDMTAALAAAEQLPPAVAAAAPAIHAAAHHPPPPPPPPAGRPVQALPPAAPPVQQPLLSNPMHTQAAMSAAAQAPRPSTYAGAPMPPTSPLRQPPSFPQSGQPVWRSAQPASPQRAPTAQLIHQAAVAAPASPSLLAHDTDALVGTPHGAGTAGIPPQLRPALSGMSAAAVPFVPLQTSMMSADGPPLPPPRPWVVQPPAPPMQMMRPEVRPSYLMPAMAGSAQPFQPPSSWGHLPGHGVVPGVPAPGMPHPDVRSPYVPGMLPPMPAYHVDWSFPGGPGLQGRMVYDPQLAATPRNPPMAPMQPRGLPMADACPAAPVVHANPPAPNADAPAPHTPPASPSKPAVPAVRATPPPAGTRDTAHAASPQPKRDELPRVPPASASWAMPAPANRTSAADTFGVAVEGMRRNSSIPDIWQVEGGSNMPPASATASLLTSVAPSIWSYSPSGSLNSGNGFYTLRRMNTAGIPAANSPASSSEGGPLPADAAAEDAGSSSDYRGLTSTDVLVEPSPVFVQFTCPLTRKIMVEPMVAADGFTYERSAIEGWLLEHDTSPVTKQPLPSKDLVPNMTMRTAIQLLAMH